MLGDDPPYLSVGTEVSAKYKGAFCEAKIRKVVRSVKCRVTYKQGLGTATVTDDQIKGTLRVGASVEARHNDRKEFVEATITKIQDCSQYTVVFDDGDITTLRRTALCLKSGRHFAESETLDQLPLTHPEHFGNPVIGGRRGRRSRQTQDDSSDDEDDAPRGSNDSGSGSGSKEGPETEPEIGRVICVELSGDKKKKDNWFPGLVVSPTTQNTVRIRIRDDFLVRSFKDARYYTVPKKEVTEFTKELGNKVESSALKVAVERALLFLEKNELPPHWDRDLLFRNAVSSGNSDSDGELDSDSSDDEPREEKDHFVAQLYKFMDDRGTPINNCPMIGNEDIDLYRLFRAVYKLGGYNRVTNQNQWKLITRRLSFSMQNSTSTHNLVKQAYKKFLHSFEEFYRKLGCTMVNHPRGSIRKQRAGRSLIRDKDRNTPVPIPDNKPVIKTEKDEEDKDKKPTAVPEEDVKKEKREIKKEPLVKEEDVQVKIKRKEEPVEESVSGQESDINIEEEEESSSSEKSQKSSARLTPSSTVGAKTKTTTTAPTKSKEDTAKKKILPEKKKPEPKKQEKKDDKLKEDDSTKTRSKSKEDIAKGGKPTSATETRETRTPSRESDKKVFTKQRRMTDEELKKRGRKKKEVEGEKGRTAEERSVEYAPSYKGPVEIGDRLKVYYGPTHESKVTYEAKVIDMEKDGSEAVYLVHYTGWNTRYDEWIKGTRIAQNFTQAQGRVKRTKATPRPQTPSTSSSGLNKSSKTTTTAPNAGTGAAASAGAQSRRRAQGDAPSGATGTCVSFPSKDSRKDEREGTPAGRSTPSPLTSSALRTKSPATTANSRTSARLTRNADSASSNDLNSRRRTRRTSGHADAMAAEESESEDSESMESDASAEPETAQAQSRARLSAQERSRREARRRAESRMKIEETSDAEGDKDVEEPRRGRRLRKTIGKLQEVKSEPESDDEQPKGRDFDLNQIRSELKGFDKAVKLEIPSVEPELDEEEEEQTSIPVKSEKTEAESNVEKKVIPEPEKKREAPKAEPPNAAVIKRDPIKIEASQCDSTEDIYEFKEPEPFEFEVRNKRDSGGSTGNNDKEKEKDKDKAKKRTFDEDQKSPKKRQKSFNAAGSTPTKVDVKSDSSPTETVDAKKKARKIFKKSDETDEADVEAEDSSRELAKFFPASYSGVTVFKRRGAFGNAHESFPDDADNSSDTPKKRQPKTFTGTTTSKSNEVKPETANQDNSESKKKVRKIFNKKADETDDIDEADDSNKELARYFPNYPGAKTLSRVKPTVEAVESEENSLGDRDKPKKNADEDVSKNSKKRQKSFGVAAAKTETSAGDAPDAKKKTLRRATNKKETEDSEVSGSDEAEELPIREHATYFSHYSGPKTKAAAIASDSESSQERISGVKLEAQSSESSKLFTVTANAVLSQDKDDAKTKPCEPVTTTPALQDNKQLPGCAEKKRAGDSTSSTKPEAKQELKPLDFTPIVPHALPVPAPISTRLPATASIEEKLSAAAVFRSKLKENKKDEEPDNMPRKTLKDIAKKTEVISAKKVKEKDESKMKHETEKKKPQPTEQTIPKKDPLQEIELRKDPLLEVIKKKEDDLNKNKKETETKAVASSTVPNIPKTYSAQKKEQPTKQLEEVWKKTSGEEPVVCEVPNAETTLRKETIVSKIKSTIDRDSVDSTDSSDSERRLTIIDSEEFFEDKCNDVETKTKTASINCVIQEQGPATQTELTQQIVGVVGAIVQTKTSKMEEDGENLNSLLCEEEIPGSPTPCSESMDQDHRATSSQTLVNTDIGSKVAVAFVAAQLPLSTVGSATQITNSAMVSTISGSSTVPQSTNSLVTVSISVQHTSAQSIRQPQVQVQPQQQLQVQPQQVQQVQHQHIQPQPQQQPQQQQQQQQQNQVAQLPVVVQRRESNDAAPVMDNTPPTTPDSIISNISGSPRDEGTGGSTPPSSEDTNSKTNRDNSEAENESAGKEEDGSSPGNSDLAGNGPTSSTSGERMVKPPPKRVGGEAGEGISPKKRKKRKDQETQNGASGKKSPRQSARNSTRHGNASDSDDTSEGSNVGVNNSTAQTNNMNTAPAAAAAPAAPSLPVAAHNGAVATELGNFSTRSPRPTKYNFLVELDPSLDGNQRIAILQQKLTELRKTYNNVKTELAAIERRRKKLKRREREAQKAAKAEMQQACS